MVSNTVLTLDERERRIYEFLGSYIDFSSKIQCIDDEILKTAIKVLTDNGVFTPEQLRKECLWEQNAIIPWDWIYGEEVWRTEN